MNIEQFKQDPMSIHDAYGRGFFHWSRAPEYTLGEVIIASLYRTIGFVGIGEGQVTKVGKAFSTNLAIDNKANPSKQTGIGWETWRFIVDSILESPKSPKQPKTKFIQLTPLVPDASLYSLSARYTGNPWNPGALFKSIIGYGCNTQIDAQNFWSELFEALSVNESDDIWARLLSQEFSVWRAEDVYKWEERAFQDDDKCKLAKQDREKYRIPAKQFVQDLRSLISLKQDLTRRQWISLVESLARIGTVSHVLWICDINKRIWDLFQDSLRGVHPLEVKEMGETIMPVNKGFWRYGESAIPVLKEKVRSYATARVGINYVMYLLDELVQSGKPDSSIPRIEKFERVEDVHNVCLYLFEKRESLRPNEIFIETTKLLERDPRLLTCSKGITSNISEFLRYSLGQRQTQNEEHRNYDQGYWIRKKGKYPSAPWLLAAGPVALMAMAYCCGQGSSAPRTIDFFCKHLGQYGIMVNPAELSSNGLSQSLKALGVVIDSPDAEGGMVVLNPFKRSA